MCLGTSVTFSQDAQQVAQYDKNVNELAPFLRTSSNAILIVMLNLERRLA